MSPPGEGERSPGDGSPARGESDRNDRTGDGEPGRRDRSEGQGSTDHRDRDVEVGDAPRPVRSSEREERRPDPEPGSEDEEEDAMGDWILFVRDIASSVVAVMLVGFFLFAVSGVWPPLVAVESGSMLPHMQRNDLVFVMEEERFPGEGARHGVVTARVGAETGYTKFGKPGDVIVYTPNGNGGQTPIIHRAMFWVEAGENWCRMGNPAYIGRLDPSDPQCTADHAGFITKGDNNADYDQAMGLSPPVKPEWVVGTAEFRLPGLGWIRLRSAG